MNLIKFPQYERTGLVFAGINLPNLLEANPIGHWVFVLREIELKVAFNWHFQPKNHFGNHLAAQVTSTAFGKNCAS